MIDRKRETEMMTGDLDAALAEVRAPRDTLRYVSESVMREAVAIGRQEAEAESPAERRESRLGAMAAPAGAAR